MWHFMSILPSSAWPARWYISCPEIYVFSNPSSEIVSYILWVNLNEGEDILSTVLWKGGSWKPPNRSVHLITKWISQEENSHTVNFAASIWFRLHKSKDGVMDFVGDERHVQKGSSRFVWDNGIIREWRSRLDLGWLSYEAPDLFSSSPSLLDHGRERAIFQAMDLGG